MSGTHTPTDFITSLSAAAFCAVLAELPDPAAPDASWLPAPLPVVPFCTSPGH